MNYTILGDMYSNANIPYTYAEGNVTLSSKAAKLNGETKRPTLVNNWITKRPNLTVNQTNELKEMNTIVSDVASSTHGYDVVLSGLGLALAKHDAMSTVSGFRKLKVNRVVNDKTRKVYDTLDDKVIVQVANQNDINTVIKDEMINESIKMPQVEETVRDVQPINYTAMAPVSETRTAKHEYDLGEQTNIINTPERFQNKNSDFSANKYPDGNHVSQSNLSRVEKNSYIDDNHAERIQVGKEANDLNIISRKMSEMRGQTSNESELTAVYDNYLASEKKKKMSQEEVLQLEKAVQEAKQQLAEKRTKEMKYLKERTKDNEEKTLEYTMHSEDLKQQLAELRDQLTRDSSFVR